MVPVAPKLTPQQKREIMTEAQCDVKTLRNWITKGTMKPTTRARLDAAWRKVRANGSGK